jgi:hypothetical protein
MSFSCYDCTLPTALQARGVFYSLFGRDLPSTSSQRVTAPMVAPWRPTAANSDSRSLRPRCIVGREIPILLDKGNATMAQRPRFGRRPQSVRTRRKSGAGATYFVCRVSMSMPQAAEGGTTSQAAI